MAYDTHRSRVVLFGGADAGAVRGDTWEYDGRRWVLVSGEGPGLRTFPAMAFDDVRRETVLFGGNRVLFGAGPDSTTFLADTWRWDGFAWTRDPGQGPSPRAEAAMAFDPRRARIVLFGGYRITPAGLLRLGDTWEWDGAQWREVGVGGPTPRHGSAFAFDPRRGTLLLFGGRDDAAVAGDTWEWDGLRWSPIPTSPTPARYNAVMVQTGGDAALIRFGGWDGARRVADTWFLTGTQWVPGDFAGPEARNHTALVYDVARRCAVLFGGHDGTNVFGDTWEWSDSGWLRRMIVAPQHRLDNGH